MRSGREVTRNELEINKSISKYIEQISHQGLDIVQLFDFNLLSRICHDRDKLENEQFSLTEQFSTKYFDFSPQTAFWLAARNSEGQVVSVQAARLDQLGELSLADFWMQQQRRIYCDPYPDISAELGDWHCPDAYHISGLCVYHGNMWIRKEWKGRNLSRPLCRLGQLIAFAKWEFDYIYCFIQKELVSKGFAAHQGYNHTSPCGTEWNIAPDHIRGDDYLCYNRPADLAHLVRVTNESSSASLSYMP